MALVASGFFMCLLGSVEIGRYAFVSESLKHLVGELARATVVDPDRVWSAEAKNAFVMEKTAALTPADFQTLDVVVARAAAPALTTVTVTANYRFNLNVPALSNAARVINAGVTMRFVAP